MTATIADILPAVLARLAETPLIVDAHSNTLPFRYRDDGAGNLPDTPTAFAFVEHENFGSGRGPAEYGGGRSSNIYRNEGLITVFVFNPKEGLLVLNQLAETIAARLRSYRTATLSCFAADVRPIVDGSSLRPPGLASEVNNYACAVVEVAMHFDQVG